jgi:hypothetical protein
MGGEKGFKRRQEAGGRRQEAGGRDDDRFSRITVKTFYLPEVKITP